ncbi:iron-siderophore ABC transporter substrate-binding protein [Pseudonocardia humida]|uniref:Iron-siderophore ABC transporter substrate-binding protein n=1 Tax=Pseudonocardia humida TaxID=2800819 RepID=A0ABT1A2A3_9PSEU|nr:iron-siderophore ABC transporter substrate-binding protein [Pseudonocardia humida]MCO1657050.1 iron-siderophore ABC transporter substrate-binding protein [Pseudonocardia humida]
MAVAVTAAAALLAGCGQGGGQDSGQGAPAPAETAAAPSAASAFPVTVAGKEGTATIPAQPERVVTVGLQRDTDIALALGVTPVGMAKAASFPSGVAPWVEPVLAGEQPELVDMTSGQPPLESIAALDPDVILAVDDYALAEHFEQLSQIAPTVSYAEAQNTDTWQESTQRIATALGVEDKAAGVIADAEAAVRDAAAANPGLAGRTFSFSVVYSGTVYTVLGSDAAATVLTQLGMELAPAVAALPESTTKGRAQVSEEQISTLDADVVMVSYATPADQAALEANPLFQRLSAVSSGAYFPLDFNVGVALAFPSPLATPYAVEGIVPPLKQALKL